MNDGAAPTLPANGQPLITERFPLSRLALFANPMANAGAIQTYFGLTQVSGHTWLYKENGVSGPIMTLAQVATSNPPRQPDFFELLQAAVLSGSLYNYLGGATGQASDNTFVTGKSAKIIMKTRGQHYQSISVR